MKLFKVPPLSHPHPPLFLFHIFPLFLCFCSESAPLAAFPRSSSINQARVAPQCRGNRSDDCRFRRERRAGFAIVIGSMWFFLPVWRVSSIHGIVLSKQFPRESTGLHFVNEKPISSTIWPELTTNKLLSTSDLPVADLSYLFVF